MTMRRMLLATTALAFMAGGGVFAATNAPLSANYAVEVGTPSNLVGVTPITTPGANATSLVLKAGPGNLYSAYATNASGTAGKLLIINSTAAPAAFGVVTNVLDCVAVPANGTGGVSGIPGPPTGYSVGITALFSSNASCYVWDQTTAAITAFMKGIVF